MINNQSKMKVTKFNLYSTITTLAILVLLAIVVTVFNSCATTEAIKPKPDVIFPMDDRDKDMLLNVTTRSIGQTMADTPTDWAYHAPQPIVVDTDTVVIDTIIVDPPCEDSLYLLPEFVTGFMEIDEIVSTNIEVWVYPHQATATEGEQIHAILDSLLNEYDPSLTYRVYQSDTDWRRMAFIAEGTLDKEHFHGEVFLRFNGHNSGWGFGVTPQAFLFAGSLTFDEYMEAADLYPSVNYFNNRNAGFTQEEEIKLARKIRQCHLGRYWADFRFNQFQIPDTIITQFEIAGWEKVLH